MGGGLLICNMSVFLQILFRKGEGVRAVDVL